MGYKTSFLIRPFGISVDRGIRTLCRKRHYCRLRTTSHCSHARRNQWSTRGFFVRLAAVVRTLEPYFDILNNAVGSIPEMQLGLSVFGTLRSRHGTITYPFVQLVHIHYPLMSIHILFFSFVGNELFAPRFTWVAGRRYAPCGTVSLVLLRPFCSGFIMCSK